MEDNDERHPQNDPVYKELKAEGAVLPSAESLKTTIDRVLPYWDSAILPAVRDGKSCIVVAHGNSLRAIVKQLSDMSSDEILKYNIPTAVPFVYEFDKDLNPLLNYYLLDEDEVKQRQEAVAKQASAKKS